MTQVKANRKEESQVVFARFRDKETYVKLYAMAIETNVSIRVIVEQAVKFAFKSKSFKVEKKRETAAERVSRKAAEAKEKKLERFKKLTAAP